MFGFLFREHLECVICGKHAYLLDFHNNGYCKKHKNLQVIPPVIVCACWKNYGENGRHDVNNCDCTCHI